MTLRTLFNGEKLPEAFGGNPGLTANPITPSG
jgi:hypothetical protein